MSYFKAALNIDCNYADAHYNMAVALSEIDQYAAAKKHIMRYLELDGKSKFAKNARQFLKELEVMDANRETNT